MFESCLEIREQFSDYVDGLCSDEVQRSVRYHLRYCGCCQEELERAQVLGIELRGLPRAHLSAQADLRLKVRVSRELNKNLLTHVVVRLSNIFQGKFLPAGAGLALAVLCFCLFLGFEAVPATTRPDVALSFITPPQVVTLAPLDFDTGSKPVIVLTNIDSTGQVMGYKVVSGQHSPELMHNLDRLIYSSRFSPATTFGEPTDGKVILALKQITVRG
ncbi:MAG: zf-HC2 domain-containing protein [Terriglobia bacterium]